MRNSYIVNISVVAFCMLILMACTSKPAHTGHQEHQEMPPDSSITRLTTSVNTRIISTIPAIRAESGTHVYSAEVNGIITYDNRNQVNISSRIGGRVERLFIKYNYQPVKRGQLIMEIYSPDLAAAQRELLYVARNSTEMLAAAKQRLVLLGMQSAQVEQVVRTGNILYRVPVYSNADGYILEKSAAATQAPAVMPASSGAGAPAMGGMNDGTSTAAPPAPAAPSATPLLLREGQYVNAGQSLFTIYQTKTLIAEFAFPANIAPSIKHGQQILFYPADDENRLQSGNIGLIEPVFKNGLNFTVARVYLPQTPLPVGQLLTASIPVVYTDGWWLPKKSVVQLGNKSVVFKKDKDAYIPVTVETGAQAKDRIQVKTDISDWEIASNAQYLVDSESFIKTIN